LDRIADRVGAFRVKRHILAVAARVNHGQCLARRNQEDSITLLDWAVRPVQQQLPSQHDQESGVLSSQVRVPSNDSEHRVSVSRISRECQWSICPSNYCETETSAIDHPTCGAKGKCIGDDGD